MQTALGATGAARCAFQARSAARWAAPFAPQVCVLLVYRVILELGLLELQLCKGSLLLEGNLSEACAWTLLWDIIKLAVIFLIGMQAADEVHLLTFVSLPCMQQREIDPAAGTASC